MADNNNLFTLIEFQNRLIKALAAGKLRKKVVIGKRQWDMLANRTSNSVHGVDLDRRHYIKITLPGYRIIQVYSDEPVLPEIPDGVCTVDVGDLE